MIIKLASGILEFEDTKGKYHYFFIKKGFMKIENNQIILLTEIIQSEEAMISKEIKKRLAEINQKIKGASQGVIKADELDRLLIERKDWVVKNKLVSGHIKNG
jgi:F0F1-type ATP synthase epsilon subunit